MKNMFKIFIVGISICLISCNNKIRTPKNDNERIVNLMVDALDFSKSLQNMDLSKFVDLTNSKFVELNGGKQSYLQDLKKGLEQISKSGQKIVKVSIKEANVIIKGENSFYSILDQESIQSFSYPGSKEFSIDSKVLAVSLDNGVTWKFLNVDFLKSFDLSQLFPTNDIEKLRVYIK